MFWLTEKAVPPFPIVYGGKPPKMVTSCRVPTAHDRLLGPVNVKVSGMVKNPGLEPVDCAIVNVARRKALVPRSVTCTTPVWFDAPGSTRMRACTPPAWSEITVVDDRLVLTRLTHRGVLRGALGQIAFFPSARARRNGTGPATVAIAGMGYPGTFSRQALQQLSAQLADAVSTLPDAETLSLVLIGSGEGSLDIAELNPALDLRNTTAELAVDLVESLFGKSTLIRT